MASSTTASKKTSKKAVSRKPSRGKPKKEESVEKILATVVKALVLDLQMKGAHEDIKEDIAAWWNPDTVRLFKRLDDWGDYVKKLAEAIEKLKANGRLHPWVFSVPAALGLQTTFSGIVLAWVYSDIPSETDRRKLTKKVEEMIESRIGVFSRMIAR